MNYNLIKAERFINLREVWPHEAHSFTHWVAKKETLDLLNSEVKLKGIEDPICEVQLIGNKRADIVAKEKGTNRRIIIENQLESSNHEHLGKIVTYASGKDAEIVIWIVSEARDEYRKAIAWLNRRTDDRIDFYLVEIQLWKIDKDSLLPRFSVVERPLPKEYQKEMSDSEKELMSFWTEFNSYADSIPEHFFSKFNTKRKPYPQPNYDLYVVGVNNARIFFSLLKTTNTVKSGIYFPDDKEAFNNYSKCSGEIEELFQAEIIWDEGKKKASSIFTAKKGCNFNTIEGKNEIYEWFCNTALKWKTIMEKFGR